MCGVGGVLMLVDEASKASGSGVNNTQNTRQIKEH